MEHLYRKVDSLFVSGAKGGEPEKLGEAKYYRAEAELWLVKRRPRAGRQARMELAHSRPSAPSRLNFRVAKAVDFGEPPHQQGGSDEQNIYRAAHG
jgi:hypothetical protein